MRTCLLLDHDGVLVDTEPWYFRAAERALEEVGIRLEADRYMRDMNLGLGSWGQAREAGLDEETLGRLRRVRHAYYQEALRTQPIEIDGVVDTLATLSPHVRLAIVTTARREDFELIHRQRGITRFMDFVLTREDYTHAKPHPEPYLEGLRRFGARPEEALVVEDSARGVASAVAAGIDCAIVHHDFTQGSDFTGARYRLDTFDELADLVLGGG